MSTLTYGVKVGGQKYFISVDLHRSKYTLDTTPLGNLMNWMNVKGASSTMRDRYCGKVLNSTYAELVTLTIL